MNSIITFLSKMWMIGPLFKHRNLLIRFTQRYIERQTRGSWLGLFWLVLDPLLRLGLFTVVFGMIMGGDFRVVENPGRFDFPLGIFIGLTVLGMINGTMGMSSGLIFGNQNLVKKVQFPLEVLPVALVGSIGFSTLVSIGLAVLGIVLVGPGLAAQNLWFLAIILPLLITAVGLAYLLSALGVFFRDSQQMMGFLTMALFYSSAVFYPVSRIPEPIFEYLRWNPVLHAIEQSRHVLLWDLPVNFGTLGYLYIFGFVTYLIGYAVFQWLRPGFADVL